MARLNNPFVVYGYKGAGYFCDRQKETEKMISSLHNERNITLVAPRRMGKTGLIHHVFHQMEEQYEGVKCCYVPMQQEMRPDVAKDTSGRNFRSVLAPIKRATKRVMVVQLKGLWLYDYKVYGCTTIGCMVVRL